MEEQGKIDEKRVENKLLLLYLFGKMDLSLTRSFITQAILEGEYMDYFTLQETIGDMVGGRYLVESSDGNNTSYSITDEGISTLEYLEKHIPQQVRNRLNKYVHDNYNILKRDYQITANIFPDDDLNEYIVKCGVYEDDAVLMEIHVAVDAPEQARLIRDNWKSNVNTIYNNILMELIAVRTDNEKNEQDKE